MLADLKFAFRTLAKTPGFAVFATLTLAMAIGVALGMSNLINERSRKG